MEFSSWNQKPSFSQKLGFYVLASIIIILKKRVSIKILKFSGINLTFYLSSGILNKNRPGEVEVVTIYYFGFAKKAKRETL